MPATKRIYFVGVDGGGTKTLLRLADSDGKVIAEGVGGPANIRLSVEQTWDSILNAWKSAMAYAGLIEDSGDFYCGAGLAGTEIPDACETFLETKNPFKHVELESDGYTSCMGAHNGADGAIIAIGTGVIAYQIDGDVSTSIGGWGFPHGDEGGGAWIGLNAVRATFQWLDGRLEKAPLYQAVFEHFHEDKNEMVIWANSVGSTEFASLTPLVVNYAKKQDPAAKKCMEQAAHEIDRYGDALLEKQHTTDPLPCCLLGGLGNIIEPWLDPRLKERLIPAKSDSTAGALLMIRRVFSHTIS